ncbi:MAG: hypothetical protein PHC28_09455 [Flavobacterium sp.]|uniref:hypothetical protein n=1 Tax=Flavobacterium sp. TaxID=239 RepID=UPI00260A10A0|nr:hypothetical protein [Flavobacterium sp.]MDD5150691.1 hypothetical protein [Flavobacterium sp.]
MKALLIKSCNRGEWYGNFIGKIVPYVRTVKNPIEYQSREFAGYTNFVQIHDAELIDVEDDFRGYY